MNTISCGSYHSIAIKEDERNNCVIVEWGICFKIIPVILSSIGWNTNSPKTYTHIKAIACGHNHSVAIKEDGTIICSHFGVGF